MLLVWQTTINGIIESAFFALISVGLSLVYGVMKTANFAHGEFYMIGAYIVWLVYTVAHQSFLVAIIVAVVVVGAMGVLAELAIFRPVRGRLLSGFLMSLGLSYILQVIVGQELGTGPGKDVSPYFTGSLNLFGAYVGWQRVAVVPAAILILGGFFFFLYGTSIGRGLRACAQDRETASLYGISVNRMALIALAAGSAMAGVAGALMAPIMAVTPYMGQLIIWTCFVVIIVGGLGNLKGSIFASIIFGFLDAIASTLADPIVAKVATCVTMLVVLSIRPQGLVGYAKR